MWTLYTPTASLSAAVLDVAWMAILLFFVKCSVHYCSVSTKRYILDGLRYSRWWHYQDGSNKLVENKVSTFKCNIESVT